VSLCTQEQIIYCIERTILASRLRWLQIGRKLFQTVPNMFSTYLNECGVIDLPLWLGKSIIESYAQCKLKQVIAQGLYLIPFSGTFEPVADQLFRIALV
jgi:hypothetical protein